jgi:hypothetical protein
VLGPAARAVVGHDHSGRRIRGDPKFGVGRLGKRELHFIPALIFLGFTTGALRADRRHRRQFDHRDRA